MRELSAAAFDSSHWDLPPTVRITVLYFIDGSGASAAFCPGGAAFAATQQHFPGGALAARCCTARFSS